MKKVLILIFLVAPLLLSAQSDLTVNTLNVLNIKFRQTPSGILTEHYGYEYRGSDRNPFQVLSTALLVGYDQTHFTITPPRNNGDLLMSGNLGVGTTTPQDRIEINGNLRFTHYGQSIRWGGSGSKINEDYGIQILGEANAPVQVLNTALLVGYNQTIATDPVLGAPRNSGDLLVSGKVGIGTLAPCLDCKLEVRGKIRTEEVLVEIIGGTGPDYVFKDDYELRTLEEVQSHIEKHSHLPEIPSAKEMESEGVELGEMNMLLLKKIEELTLYQLQLLEMLKSQQERIELLESR